MIPKPSAASQVAPSRVPPPAGLTQVRVPSVPPQPLHGYGKATPHTTAYRPNQVPPTPCDLPDAAPFEFWISTGYPCSIRRHMPVGPNNAFWSAYGCLLGTLEFVLSVAGLLLHLFTVASIWTLHGPVIGALSFFLPGIAEIYLLFKAAVVNPLGWGNNYTLFFFTYLGLLLSWFVIAWIGAASSSRKRQD